MTGSDEYRGYREFVMEADTMAEFYETMNENAVECKTNEYIVIYNTEGAVADQLRWNGDRFVEVPFRSISSRYCDKIKPRNIQQRLAIDMLYNNNITIKMIAGRQGTGKDLLMSSAAADLLDKGKIEKIVYVRNNIEVKNSKPIEHLPGSYEDKLMPYAMVLADKFGGREGLEAMMQSGMVEISHLGFMRGRDIKNSIIYCSEAENMTKEHIQLLITRVGEGSSLWINGDLKQTDMDVFEKNSGMKCAIEKLTGHPRFGYVKLQKTERSETVAMADLLDQEGL